MVNLQSVFMDKNGQPVKQVYRSEEFKDGEVKPVSDYRETTLMDIIRVSLLKGSEDSFFSSLFKEKNTLKRYQMYRKLEGNTEIELTNKEIKFVSKLICKHYDTLFAGQAIEMLNN